MQNNEYAIERVWQAYSLRTRFQRVQPARRSGCGQGCPPYKTGGTALVRRQRVQEETGANGRPGFTSASLEFSCWRAG
jgi:hypothetical protein